MGSPTQSGRAEPRNPSPVDPFGFPSGASVFVGYLLLALLATTVAAQSQVYASLHTAQATRASRCLTDVLHATTKPRAMLLTGQRLPEPAAREYDRLIGPVQRACNRDYLHDQLLWTLAALALFVALVGISYLAHTSIRIRMRGLQPLASAEDPQLTADAHAIVAAHASRRPPTVVWDPLDPRAEAVVFGRSRRPHLSLAAGAIVLHDSDPRSFATLLRHELAHVANRDLLATHLTIAAWRVCVLLDLVPLLVVLLWANDPARVWHLVGAPLIYLGLTVYLLRNAVLRAREHYADLRVCAWDAGPEQVTKLLHTMDAARTPRRSRWSSLPSWPATRVARHALRIARLGWRILRTSIAYVAKLEPLPLIPRAVTVLRREPTAAHWRAVAGSHPRAATRIELLGDPAPLLLARPWVALGLGIAVGLSAQNLSDVLLNTLGNHFGIAAWDVTLTLPIVFGVGISAWREATIEAITGKRRFLDLWIIALLLAGIAGGLSSSFGRSFGGADWLSFLNNPLAPGSREPPSLHFFSGGLLICVVALALWTSECVRAWSAVPWLARPDPRRRAAFLGLIGVFVAVPMWTLLRGLQMISAQAAGLPTAYHAFLRHALTSPVTFATLAVMLTLSALGSTLWERQPLTITLLYPSGATREVPPSANFSFGLVMVALLLAAGSFWTARDLDDVGRDAVGARHAAGAHLPCERPSDPPSPSGRRHPTTLSADGAIADRWVASAASAIAPAGGRRRDPLPGHRDPLAQRADVEVFPRDRRGPESPRCT